MPMTTSVPRIAIVGCGAIAEAFYLPALSRHPEVLEHLTLVDRSEARARALGQKFRVNRFAIDYHDLPEGIDGAIVAVPHHLHYAVAMDLLARRVHVLCEKPLAESSSEANKMIREAEDRGVTLMVNSSRRLMPTSVLVKKLVGEGAIGTPLSITYIDGAVFDWPTASGFYFNSKVSTKGVLLDIGAHVFDLVCWWLDGKPSIVSSENDAFGGCEAVASVVLDYRGCRCSIRLSRLARLSNLYEITGTQGSIKAEVYDPSLLTLSHGKRTKTIQAARALGVTTDCADTLVTNFLAVINGTAQPLIPARVVVSPIELIEEAYCMAQRFPLPWYEPCEGLYGR
jgi:predicted dehydrogenase